MDDDIQKVIRHIRQEIGTAKLGAAKPDDAFPYAAVALCIIDAIFSIQATYETTWKTVCRWATRHKWELCRWRAQQERQEHTTTDFLRLMEPYEDRFDEIAKREFRNEQKIPAGAKTEITKAEAVIRFARVLQQFGIETLDEALKIGRSGKVRSEIEKIPGHGPGVIYNYFLMMVGWEDAVKADGMITRFVGDSLGRKSPADPQRSEILVRTASRILITEFPNLTPSLLDNVIWRYQRGVSKEKSVSRHKSDSNKYPWEIAAMDCAKYRNAR
jgi:hypothetical protein